MSWYSPRKISRPDFAALLKDKVLEIESRDYKTNKLPKIRRLQKRLSNLRKTPPRTAVLHWFLRVSLYDKLIHVAFICGRKIYRMLKEARLDENRKWRGRHTQTGNAPELGASTPPAPSSRLQRPSLLKRFLLSKKVCCLI